MLFIIIVLVSIFWSFYFVSQLPDDNYQDPIVGMAFKLGLIFVVCSGIIYYFHNYYPYCDIVYKTIEISQIYKNSYEDSNYVEEYDNMYVYYDKDGQRKVVEKENARIIYEDCKPYIEICEVYQKYNVSSHFIFNLMIALRFDDYSDMINEEYYLIHIPANDMTS